MNRRTFTKSTNRHGGPGQWWPWPTAKRVTVWCPDCGNAATLDHDIADDGTVSPSLVCPHVKHDACGFHEFVKLEGWESR